MRKLQLEYITVQETICILPSDSLSYYEKYRRQTVDDKYLQYHTCFVSAMELRNGNDRLRRTKQFLRIHEEHLYS